MAEDSCAGPQLLEEITERIRLLGLEELAQLNEFLGKYTADYMRKLPTLHKKEEAEEPKSEGVPVQKEVKWGGIRDEANRIIYPAPGKPGKPRRY